MPSYNIEDRTPEQYGVRTWKPPPGCDGSGMRSRYVEPYLDELHQDHELFHPAGPYASGQSQYKFDRHRNRIDGSRRSNHAVDYSSDVSPRGTRYGESSYHLRFAAEERSPERAQAQSQARAPSSVHPGSSVSQVYERRSANNDRVVTYRYEDPGGHHDQRSGSEYLHAPPQRSASYRPTGSMYESGVGSRYTVFSEHATQTNRIAHNWERAPSSYAVSRRYESDSRAREYDRGM